MKKKSIKTILALVCIITLLICSAVVVIAITGEKITDEKSVSRVMYNPALDNGFKLENKVTKTEYGSYGYTSVSVATTDGTISKFTYNGAEAFGINGTSVNINLKINHETKAHQRLNGSKEWMLCNDSYGSVEGQTINGIATGRVDTGTLIIQTSSDNINWSNSNMAKYTNGLYTTDYAAHHGNDKVTIYTPSGNDVNNGIYVRVLYAYEIYDYVECTHTYKDWHGPFYFTTEKSHENDNTYVNYVEAYTFYLCNKSLDAVTFKNLSLAGSKKLLDENGEKIEVKERAETLINNSVTVNGFKIENSLNPSVKISMLKNSTAYNIPSNKEIKEDGRYDITLENKLNEKKTFTIYVLKKDSSQLNEAYFCGKFIDGKRIYDESSDVPVYEGGSVSYSLSAYQSSLPRLYGYIENLSTGSVTQISQNGKNLSQTIFEAGKYKAVFYTNSTFNTDTPSGDNHTISFSFKVIPEGTAPGPIVNKEQLTKYSENAQASNVNPIYYGVTFCSAGAGRITLAFATREAAREFAYNYEKSMVELQSDGSYRYTGSLAVTQKVKYESGWDLTEAVNFFVDECVEQLYFDLSDQFTYATLENDVTESIENLRTLELSKSVVVFASEGEAKALLAKASLPIINNKPYCYVVPGNEAEAKMGYTYFAFVKDSLGLDSNKVTIIDANGKSYSISYNTSVEEQLTALDSPTGIVTIREETYYGDQTEYQAIYIRPNEVTAEATIVGYNKENEAPIKITQANDKESIILNGFYIESVMDEYDSYTLVKIEFQGMVTYCSASELNKNKLFEPGKYVISLINRLGSSFTYTINVEAYFNTVDIVGEDGNITSVKFADNENVRLPLTKRYGYNLVGYKDQNGNLYSAEVAGVSLKGATLLEPVYEAKKFNLTLVHNNKVLDTKVVKFGESYQLPSMKDTSAETFVGWLGIDCESPVDAITISREADVIMVSSFKAMELSDVNEATDNNHEVLNNTENEQTENVRSTDKNSTQDTANKQCPKAGKILITILFSVAAIGAGCIFYLAYKKAKTS